MYTIGINRAKLNVRQNISCDMTADLEAVNISPFIDWILEKTNNNMCLNGSTERSNTYSKDSNGKNDNNDVENGSYLSSLLSIHLQL